MKNKGWHWEFALALAVNIIAIILAIIHLIIYEQDRWAPFLIMVICVPAALLSAIHLRKG